MTFGLSPIQPFLDSGDVREIMVVNGGHLWIDDHGGIREAGHLTATQVALLIEGIARASGRRVDTLHPVLDAALPDGSRACIVLPPVARHGASISIRKFPSRVFPLAAFGPEARCDEVRALVASRRNVVVSGATGSGKTSLVSTVTQLFAQNERIVCLEDTAEIKCAHNHFVSLQTRPANQEGAGEVTLHDLVRTSLRMRPDRLIVGEVRGAEVVDMVLALGSGHTGCWSTLHAASAADTAERLVALLLRHHHQWSASDARSLVASAIDTVVHVSRTPGGRRAITDIVHVRGS